jgi:hypothetical protein
MDTESRPADVTSIAGEEPAPHLSMRVVWGFLAVGLLLFFFILPHNITGDGRLRYDALQSWLAGSGVPNTKFPLIGSLLSIPLMLLGHVVASPEWWVARYNVLVYAAGLGLLYALLRDRIATDLLGAFLILLGTTAMLPNSLTGFGVETFTAMAVGTGLVAWSVGHWKTGAVLMGVGVANTPAAFVGLAVAMGWWAWKTKRARALVPLVVSTGLWMIENTVRHNSPLATGYENDHGFQTLLPYSGLSGFSYPTPFGVLSLLLSFGKGVLFFAPGLLLLFRRGLDALRSVKEIPVLWVLYLAGMLLVYGTWWAWYGGLAWGPRFLVFASLPAALLLAAQVRRPPSTLRALSAVFAALLLSVWVGIDGQTFGQFAQSQCTTNHYYLEAFCWYVPEFSVLWTPFVFHASVSAGDLVLIAYAVGATAYVAYPLLRQWAAAARREIVLGWAAYNRRAPWRF